MNSDVSDRRKRSKPRPGTANKGQEYEIVLPALFSLKFLEDPAVKNFTLKSNIKDFDSFDDLVVSLELEDGTKENYAFQFKHKEAQNIELHPETLQEGKDFNIFKHISHRHDHHFIIYTNAYFKFDKLTKFEFQPEEESPGKKHFFLPSSLGKAETYRFKPSEDGATCCSFFDRFTFYTSQKNWQGVQEQILDNFRRIFHTNDSSLALAYINIFKFWKLHEYTQIEVCKEDLQVKILDLVLSPFLSPPSTINPVLSPLEDVFTKFDFVIVSRLNVPLVSKVEFNRDEDVLHLAKDLKLVSRQAKKVSNEVREKIGYYKKGKPMVVNINDSNKDMIFAAISKVKKKHLHFVFVGQNTDKLEGAVFETLQDLLECDQNTYIQITTKMKILIRAKEYTYRELFRQNLDLNKQISIPDIIDMLQGKFQVDTVDEILTKPYITRHLSTTLVKIESISEINDLLIISSKNCKILNYVKTTLNRRLLTLDDYLTEEPEEPVIVYKGKISHDEFRLICDRNPRGNIHLFAIYDDEFLQWISTKNSIQQLSRCEIVKRATIHESNIYGELQNRVNVIVAPPGTGKSEILKKLNNACQSLPIKIDLKEHDLFFRHTDVDILDYFLFSSGDSFLVREVKKSLAKNRNVVFFFDGLDELRFDNVGIALGHIRRLSDMGFRVWLTSRPYYQKDIEKYLDVFAIDLRSFSQEEQRQYIRERLEGRKDIDKVIDEVFDNIDVILENREILDVPLQLYMVTEILRNRDSLPDNIFVLTRLFQTFLLGKYRHFFDKTKCGHWNALEKIVNDSISYRTSQYQIAALKSCLNHDEFQSLKLQQDFRFLSQVQSEGDFLGIITKITPNVEIFTHSTICTYFAASWFAENTHQVGKIIFKKEYTHVRLLFDMILAEDSVPHLAVLYRNKDLLLLHEDKIYDFDKGGRSVLHLACSNYCKHQVLDLDKIQQVRHADKKCRWILEYLLEKGLDPSRADSVLKLTCIDFAKKTESLLSSDVLLKRKIDTDLEPKHMFHAVVLSYPEVFRKLYSSSSSMDIDVFLQLAASWNNWKVLQILIDDGADINITTKSQKTLLHLASAMGHVESVTLLLFKGADVNSRDKFERTPLHLATEKGHLGTTKKLFEYGAKIDVFDKNGLTPLHLAVEKGHYELVHHFIDEKHADVNKSSWSGWGPLHLAIMGGHLDIVKMLLKRGANVDRMDEYGTKPIHLAAKHSSVEMFEVLWSKLGVGGDLTSDGRTSVHVTSEAGNLEVLRFLVGKSVSINARDGSGRTPLHWGVIGRQPQIVKLLLAHKAYVKIVDNKDRNCLQWACDLNDLTMVQLLVPKMSSLVNYRESNGSTALHWAANSGNNDIVEVLLRHGAHVDLEDREGRTALYWAASEGHPHTVELLQSKSACRVSICGKSALDYARDRNNGRRS